MVNVSHDYLGTPNEQLRTPTPPKFEVLPDPDEKTAHVPLPDGRSIPVKIAAENRAWREGVILGAALGALGCIGVAVLVLLVVPLFAS